MKITESLLRKRAEHNDGEISTLEELSLHQQNIEKIEYLDKWCRDLKILLLQCNLISKIESVGRLKKLEYLNLALNNIEVIEGLRGCESLRKLDLTVNFIGALSSVSELRFNEHLEELYLTGNPCTKFEGYREFVLATLPHLKTLDGQEIEKSERIKAIQGLEQTSALIVRQETEYLQKRVVEKEQNLEKKKERERREQELLSHGVSQDQINQEFWQEASDYTPESRVETHEQCERTRRREQHDTDEKQKKPQRRLFNDAGEPLNVNEPKLEFSITESEEEDALQVDIAVYKHLSTSELDVDVQPTYVRVTVRGRVLQLVLNELVRGGRELRAQEATSQRSLTTGHLLVCIPFADDCLGGVARTARPPRAQSSKHKAEAANTQSPAAAAHQVSKEERHELLDVPSEPAADPRTRLRQRLNIVNSDDSSSAASSSRFSTTASASKADAEPFVDDPDVPPLM